jgi:hypothetical protein
LEGKEKEKEMESHYQRHIQHILSVYYVARNQKEDRNEGQVPQIKELQLSSSSEAEHEVPFSVGN